MLGPCCQRGWATVSKFSQMPGPWLRASAVGEGKSEAKEGWACKTLQAPWPLHHKECNGEEKSKTCCYLGQAAFQRPCFHFIPKLIFLKQVLFDQLECQTSFWGKPHSFFKIGLFASPTSKGVLYFRPSGEWKAGGSHSEISLLQINGGYVGHCLCSSWNLQTKLSAIA